MPSLAQVLDRYDLKTLEDALARRRARDKQLAAAATRRRELEAELAKLNALMGGGTGTRSRKTPIVRKPNARRLNEITLADAIVKVLSTTRKPTHYQDITKAIAKRGLYRTKSKNLLSTTAVTLKRDGRFKKVKAGVWALKK